MKSVKHLLLMMALFTTVALQASYHPPSPDVGTYELVSTISQVEQPVVNIQVTSLETYESIVLTSSKEEVPAGFLRQIDRQVGSSNETQLQRSEHLDKPTDHKSRNAAFSPTNVKPVGW